MMKTICFILISTFTALLLLSGLSAAQETTGVPEVAVPETAYTFEPVVSGTTVTHTYKVFNQGTGVLEIQKVGTG